MLVVSALGGGRSGCFTAVAIAHELIVSPDPNPPVWDHQDQNILDQVSLIECIVIIRSAVCLIDNILVRFTLFVRGLFQLP